MTMAAFEEVFSEYRHTENEWHFKHVGGLPLYFSPLLTKYESVLKHAFTTRLGGETPAPLDNFNLGRHVKTDESRQDAMKNRRALCDVLTLEFDRLVVPAQKHTDKVVFVTEPQVVGDVDGVVTNAKTLPLLLHFADCVPIVIFDPVTLTLSVVHAGWRGTAQRIAGKAVEAMTQATGAKPSELVAAIGPAIGSCCYPTGDDVVQQLQSSIGCDNGSVKRFEDAGLLVKKDGRPHPNLKGVNAVQLRLAGVEQIDVSNLCTSCNPHMFYSHRQSGGNTGRQGVIASLL
jgi:YfiH family protein